MPGLRVDAAPLDWRSAVAAATGHPHLPSSNLFFQVTRKGALQLFQVRQFILGCLFKLRHFQLLGAEVFGTICRSKWCTPFVLLQSSEPILSAYVLQCHSGEDRPLLKPMRHVNVTTSKSNVNNRNPGPGFPTLTGTAPSSCPLWSIARMSSSHPRPTSVNEGPRPQVHGFMRYFIFFAGIASYLYPKLMEPLVVPFSLCLKGHHCCDNAPHGGSYEVLSAQGCVPLMGTSSREVSLAGAKKKTQNNWGLEARLRKGWAIQETYPVK